MLPCKHQWYLMQYMVQASALPVFMKEEFNLKCTQSTVTRMILSQPGLRWPHMHILQGLNSYRKM